MVARIPKTQKGELLLELGILEDENSSKFKELVRKAFGGEAQVKSLSPEITLKLKDLDEITTKEKVCESLRAQLKCSGLEISAVRSLRPAYGGIQKAIVSLPLGAARRALELTKIKIGWSVCTIRQSEQLRRCFKCWESGHITKDCKSSDRSNLCKRCGNKGHIAKDCRREPNCHSMRKD